MTFFCDTCEKDRDFDSEYGLFIATSKKEIKRICRLCRSPKVFYPDIYFDGKPEENLADDPATGRARVFFSKGEKASYLKERGLMEAGDRVHGAPVMASQSQAPKLDSRHEVQMALKKVREMGQDVRRQELLRIRKEQEKYVRPS